MAPVGRCCRELGRCELALRRFQDSSMGSRGVYTPALRSVRNDSSLAGEETEARRTKLGQSLIVGKLWSSD